MTFYHPFSSSIDKVCWEDITLPADGKGCRYFSTRKLLKILIEGFKHAINDVIPSDEENKDKSVTCKQKNDMAVLDVKVLLSHSIIYASTPSLKIARYTRAIQDVPKNIPSIEIT